MLICLALSTSPILLSSQLTLGPAAASAPTIMVDLSESPGGAANVPDGDPVAGDPALPLSQGDSVMKGDEDFVWLPAGGQGSCRC
jgi:hypothetical protein